MMVRLSLSFCLLLAMASGARGSLIVQGTVTPLVGVFQFDFSITNTGPEDVILVSIVDAPVADALIDATLTAPAGYLASYDSGLGLVDYIEMTSLFAAGTTTTGFTFQSASGPTSGFFTSFEAFEADLDFVTGTVQLNVVGGADIPEPAALAVWTLLAAFTVAGVRWSNGRPVFGGLRE